MIREKMSVVFGEYELSFVMETSVHKIMKFQVKIFNMK